MDKILPPPSPWPKSSIFDADEEKSKVRSPSLTLVTDLNLIGPLPVETLLKYPLECALIPEPKCGGMWGGALVSCLWSRLLE